MYGGVIVALNNSNIIALSGKTDDGMAVSDSDIIPHAYIGKVRVSRISLGCSENCVTQFCGKAVAAVTMSEDRRVVIVVTVSQ